MKYEFMEFIFIFHTSYFIFFFAGVTQLVECDLAKVDVAGSSPVSRSSMRLRLLQLAGILIALL
jgi:hypothetical protein